MKSSERETPSLQWRIVTTIIILSISSIFFVTGILRIDRPLVTELVAGLIVLATAGIWVSFLAEREARRTVLATAEGIRQASELSRVSAQMGLVHVFPSTDDERYHHFISDTLLKTDNEDEIRLVGVACRGFFHKDGGPQNPKIQKLAMRKVRMRVILSHPFFEPAITRAIREDGNRRSFSDHSDSILLTDVLLSCDGILGLGANSIQARLCPIALTCHGLFIRDMLIVEPLHFGSENQRASIDTPVFVFDKSATFYKRLSDHFEFLWQVSKDYKVSTGLTNSLRPRHVEIREELISYMRITRPDLFVSTDDAALEGRA